MYIDGENQYCKDQAVTASAASEHTIDHGAVRDLGVGADLYLVVTCTEAMTDSGSDSTVAVALETDSTETFTPDVTKAVGTFAAASAAGTTKILGPDDIDLRYSRLNFAVSGGNLTTGKFTGFLTTNIDKWRAYADNVTIS
jgi:hypothetical protein